MEISTRTVSRRANEAGLGCYRPVKKPLISEKNRSARLQFAKEHLNWSLQKWNTVLFSDESKYNLRGSDGRAFVRRPKGKRFHPIFEKVSIVLSTTVDQLQLKKYLGLFFPFQKKKKKLKFLHF